MKKQGISVIIPTWNRVGFLEKAMGSVLAQTRPCDELIVVDDGSTDGTADLVRTMATVSGREIRYIFQENQGAAAARNRGIAEAGGGLLCFLDSDDWWDPEKLAVQEQAMQEHPGMLISHTREIWFRRGRRVNQKKKHAPPGGEIFDRCLAMCVVGMSTVMVRAEFFRRHGLFDESLVCCEDYDLWLRAAVHEEFLLVDRPLTFKNGGRPDQLSNRYRLGMDTFRIRSICRLLEQAHLTPVQRRLALAELERKCAIYGHGCIKHGRREEGEAYLALPDRYRKGAGPVPCGDADPSGRGRRSGETVRSPAFP